MKHILIACALVAGAATAFAQDTTQVGKRKHTQQQSPESNNIRNSDMKGWDRVEPNDLPAPLKEALASEKYFGWDDPQTTLIYKNNSEQYAVRMGSGSNQMTHYFDKNGKVIPKPEEK